MARSFGVEYREGSESEKPLGMGSVCLIALLIVSLPGGGGVKG